MGRSYQKLRELFDTDIQANLIVSLEIILANIHIDTIKLLVENFDPPKKYVFYFY